jgi:hypothetical protein
MKLYHVTTEDAAAGIFAGGFEDRSGWFFGNGRGLIRGTFFCGWPARDLPGAPPTSEGAVLVTDIPDTELRPYFIADHDPAPMWIVPGVVVNRYDVQRAGA